MEPEDAKELIDDAIERAEEKATATEKIVRETVLLTAAESSGASEADKQKWTTEAQRLRAPDEAGHGIGQLQEQGAKQRSEGTEAAAAGESYELGETGLQLAIVLLSIALIARSVLIATAASIFALAGIALAIATHFGLALPHL